ncbi:hypothetical protein Tco_0459658 [Tanacetum coccineum]
MQDLGCSFAHDSNVGPRSPSGSCSDLQVLDYIRFLIAMVLPQFRESYDIFFPREAFHSIKFSGDNFRDMDLLDFIKTADPRKVRAVEVQKGDDQVTLQESTRHCFMPLVIPAAGGSSSAAAAEVPAPTEGWQEDVAEENAYLELADPDEGTAMVRRSEEEVVTEQPKKIKKKRQIKLCRQALVCLPGNSLLLPLLPILLKKVKVLWIYLPKRASRSVLLWGGEARQICLGSEVRSCAKHELEPKEKLNAKYVECSLGHHTRRTHDISLLDYRATHLESALNDAQVACTEAGTKITSLASERDRLVSEVSSLRAGFKDFKEKMEVQQEEQAQELYNRVAELEAHVMDVSGRLEGEFYPTYLTLLAGRRWLLTHGIQLAILKCLKSSEYQGILGHALGRAVDFGMQEGLEAGHEHGVAGRSLSMVDAYNPEAARASYVDAVKALEDASFPLVDLLKSKKDAGMDEVLDCFLLDGPLAGLPEAAYLRPCIEQLSVPIHHAGDKTAVGETSLSFALMNVHARAEGAKKHAAALRQLMMEIVSAPLSSQTWVGEASTSAAPLSVEDYTEEDTDEALGSVVAVPKLECCHF